MPELSKAERLVLALAAGASLAAAAAEVGLRSAEASREAHAYGYPSDADIAGAAAEIRASLDDGRWCSDGCGGCSCHVGNSAPCRHCTECISRGVTTVPPTIADQPAASSEVLRQLDVEERFAEVAAPPATPSRAILTLPLGRYIDVDGTETVIAEAVVEIELLPTCVLAVLEGGADAIDGPPVTTWVSRRLTEGGRELVAKLTAGAE